MKIYLKPYTACTKVEVEGYLLAGTGNGNNGGFRPGGGSQQPAPYYPFPEQTTGGWGQVKAGTPSPAPEDILPLEDED
ncbi:hypothetical protein J4856_05345 [Prevotella scopos JCM 17725]|jgi:hypothetical protein|uniref:Uncharacterized protein n=1 Tax=Prevotella scopos JCM 17725 TaxID=1236518 RepID=A0AAX2F2Z5_9BACT|nr:hypothetical protein [Prevotella scopos]ANR73813.1 hypothetical protein AXF22_10140 [Prevotella scopos JCM 17725]QUB44404.1 hypothetical protein J4856_05345 [Prevotella scopos JCM 17725]SHF75500.1 hypothetical protein SAMN05444364_10839 [Prevotella scopos JCM 17725]